MNTIEFQTLLYIVGLLTRSTKSTRRHALEMMNNLIYLREACFHLSEFEMYSPLRKFLSNFINNCTTADPLSSVVQPRHSLNIADPRISELFSGTIKYYSTFFIGKVRFTTGGFCRNKLADDSSIVYQTGSEVHFGRIHRIFSVNDGDLLLQVFTLASPYHFKCETASERYQYDGIETGMICSGTTISVINVKQIIEKCVFYLQPNTSATFVRFPNLVESS